MDAAAQSDVSPAAQPAASGRLTVKIDGMHCAHCAQSVQSRLSRVTGVVSADVNFGAGSAVIAYAGAPRIGEYHAAVRAAGYQPVAEADASTIGERETRRARRELLLLGWSVLWTLPVMIVHYGGMHHAWALWLTFACATVLQPTSAVTYYIGAWRSLRRRAADMDVMVSIGIAAGYIYALLSTLWPHTFTGNSMEFYEAATLLICFIRFGKWIEARSRAAAANAMGALLRLAPRTARVIGTDGQVTERAADSVMPGDRIVALPGDAFAVDGEVLEGESAADEALVTGESMPVAKSKGSRVIAGTVNQGGRLVIRATGTGKDTVLARITEMVETAQSHKAPIQRIADRISNVFVPVVILVALASGLYWSLIAHADGARVLTHVISVLVIACPCALGIAVPAAIMIGSGAALRKGILIKNGGALERLASLNRVIFDKTGTLTIGRPALTAAFAVNDDESAAFAAAARVAANSTHPLSRATVEAAALRGLAPAANHADSSASERVEEISGLGARLSAADGEYLFGSAGLMERFGVDVSALAASSESERAKGASVSYVVRDGRVLGALCFRDAVRPQARRTVEFLQRQGVRVSMLSGDAEAAARAVAAEVGIDDVTAQAKPQDKIALVKKYQDAGESVAMVGDGVNDAPALAQADVGIAIGGGTDVAQETGDIVLMSGGVENLERAVRLSHSVRRGIRLNLFVSLVYNVIGIPLAAGVGAIIWAGLVLPPGYAALAMVLSDASVALSSLWLAAHLRKL